MSVPSRPAPGGRTPDFASEQKLVEIRREAEQHGEVKSAGIRPAGSPFPIASPDTGYYGIPLLKKPAWTWEIPLYFFVGGAAGAAAVVGAIASYTGADRRLVRDARWIAAAGSVLSPALLISDLGRPERFLNMLRVFKPQSAMSVGAWTLTVFGTTSAIAALATWERGRPARRSRADLRARRPRSQAIGDASAFAAALSGLVMATYTGVLPGA